MISQLYVSSDPYYLLKVEKKQLSKVDNITSTAFRPFYLNNGNTFFFSFKSEFYFNDNAPNQENMDVRYFGKGLSYFNSFQIGWLGKYVSITAEPYILNSQNKSIKLYSRDEPYKYLNDRILTSRESFSRHGFRNAHLFIHYKGLGVGISNENMWWGPGIHSSLSMTNNTVGFPHYSIGTIKELKWKKIGFQGKYTIATIDQNIEVDNSYFTSAAAAITFYTSPIITLGVTRNYMSGGINGNVSWTFKDASKIIFEDFFLENLKSKKYTTNRGGDVFDQTLTGFMSLLFPKSKFKIYMELGFNDNRQNLWDFVIHPDHSIATIIGLQHYNFLNNENLIFGFEYANLINSRMQVFREFPAWYSRSHYNDWSYEGRRWGAHSGSDSDDFLILFGWLSDKWSFIPGINYERHGVTSFRPPEVKFEYRINSHYKFKKGLTLGIFYERQSEAHLGFPNDHYWLEVTGKRNTNTIIFRLERKFSI